MGLTRRGFMQTAGASLAAVGCLPVVAPLGKQAHEDKENAMNALDLTEIPNFCTHEHWGSIDAIGMVPEGFRADVECGATPSRKADVFDILLDPYFRGSLASAGDGPDRVAQARGLHDFRAWALENPDDAFKALSALIDRHRLTGTYQCIRRGVQALYDTDISAEFDLAALDAAIAANYAQPFSWYKRSMRIAHFSGVIRPVHPEFYVREASSGAANDERAFTRTVMRIDPLLDMWKAECPRRDALAKTHGVTPKDAESWRAFLAKLFDRAGARGAIGIKQLEAYARDLDFKPREDADVVWSGALAPDQVRVFQDWMVHECCRLADARGWPHQIHVGTHNLAHSSPLPLSTLATRYPQMKIVLLHGWPFLKECGWLAKHHPNVYLDPCWLAILNPAFYREAMNGWLGYVPTHKLLCGHDATSIEMAVGASLFTRELLARELEDHARLMALSPSHVRRVAIDILHNNAVVLYETGERL